MEIKCVGLNIAAISRPFSIQLAVLGMQLLSKSEGLKGKKQLISINVLGVVIRKI